MAPAYDLNPNADGYGLSLNINTSDNSLMFDLCMDVCSYFRWKEEEAQKELKKMKKISKLWETFAKAKKISRSEIEMMRPAFESRK